MSTRMKTEEHVGEWKISFAASTLEDVFIAVAHVIARAAGETEQDSSEWEAVQLGARDVRTLLVDWANELLGRSEARGKSYKEFRNVRVLNEGSSARITADVRGRAVRHWVSPLKAATYHSLELERTGNEWRAVVLFDV